MTHAGREKPKAKNELGELIASAFIPGISFATVSDGKVVHNESGILDAESKEEKSVNSDTQFWACSLSKPVFAYLVIQLIKNKVLGKDFNLKTPLPWDESILGPQGDKKPFTIEMILSHQTGLPNEGPPDLTFKQSKPGEIFRYSGEGLLYLQKLILERTKKIKLDDLAIEYVFQPLKMSRSSFSFPEKEGNFAQPHNEALTPNPLPKMRANDNNAAGSLHTTATDYARFLMACLNDPEFLKLLQTPQVGSMEKDIDSKSKVPSRTLQHIDWGLGFGLQKDEKGQIVSAFHWGHGPGARTFFAMNLKSKSAVVYLTNSENGLAIAEHLVNPVVGNIAPTIKFLSEKYGYRKIDSKGWKEYHNYLIEGSKAERAGHFGKAVKLYNKAARIIPENADLQYRILFAKSNNAAPIHLSHKKINDIKGQYGPVRIFIDGSKLKVEVGGERRDLKAVDHDTFLDDKVILKINSNAVPPILICHFPGGGIQNFNRNPELTSTASLATALKMSPSDLKSEIKQEAAVKENKITSKKQASNETIKESRSSHVEENDEISDEEMANSAFGQGSDTAKRLKH